MRFERGFTLIELIAVLVILGILAGVSTQFIVDSVDSYREANLRSRLLGKARLVIEQVTRYVRIAVPNSVRVSATGNCVELLPSTGGAFYEGQVADSENGAPLTSGLVTSPFALDLDVAGYALIGPLFSTEIYTAAATSSVADIGATSGSPITGITFSSPHRFLRNSINQRVFIAGSPVRFCLRSGSLWLHENYGLPVAALNDTVPSGDSAIVASDVSATAAFTLSPGTEDRNASLDLAITFNQSDVSMTMNQTVLVRNVP